jgi:hypothetical protein
MGNLRKGFYSWARKQEINEIEWIPYPKPT